ncbi:hypothetical protein QU487_19685 [Crenobacter sp. SG2305]|uniref:hypothetical protein n=1 Tax=Crenobacter oryzisoli TaxID=3056844 RepID=UPI0025AABFFA|nr:hypothetical protein [Crenobacter sp. SG2305]MDN0084941.1 hypothetical protein [Crenobacter sp. SG2305]
MDPIATAIIAALAAETTAGATDVAKKAIEDSYEELKSLLKKKFGSNSEVASAVESLENKPDSTGRQQTLAEELKLVQASADPEVLATAQALLAHLKGQPG